MPAIDNCEPAIITALQKAGWIVLAKPYGIKWSEEYPYVYADIRLRRHFDGETQEIVVVEVKCFSDPQNDLHEFYVAVGQYLFYRNALAVMNTFQPVYLAIPDIVYQRLFTRSAMQATIQDAKIKLVLVDLEKEEIVQWLN